MSSLALDFLTTLEQREMRLLGWGYVDGAWSSEELLDLADEFVIEHDKSGLVSAARLVAELRTRALLLAVDGGAGDLFRTRMAEAIRLLARLRQLFPKHHDAGWSQAASLVSDFRVVSRARSYPRRDIPAAQAVDEAVLARGDASDVRTSLEAMLAGGGTEPLRLSRFQVDATVDVLNGLASGRSGGTIVGAGTGSGKTLAFYLPALSHVAAGPDRGTRVLAIYPRIELLRDQFAEAFRTARQLDHAGALGRPIRFGALYGGTPYTAAGAERIWKSHGADRICPYMLCPTCGDGTLIWRRDDIAQPRPTLHCEHCSASISSDRLSLTREHMRDAPPDLLFTTTEMLNRTLADGRMRHLIGVGPNAMPIDLVLLDEVHTYEGTTGAQVAGVLRRWRHARRKAVHFVGLSATLFEAGTFFADLTGLTPQAVTSVEPRPQDLDHEGQEYMIAVRANAQSGASVLSTSIQASMLMQRVLDPLDDARSGGACGQRLFTFTDDLDVTNRLYFDLLDAEGLNSWGRPEKPSLAALRNPVGGDLQARRAAGQIWDSLEAIGHRLDDSAHTRIGRTTSQDADVDRLANAVVATASLEVGFNDQRVGAVLQHKAPRGAAAFLQRKGRAGRNRMMRPWTVVVLSDYGRDRATYQSYERLFDPELAARSLPIANPAVVRMQSVFALMDWLVGRLRGDVQVWRLLERPAGEGAWGAQELARQEALANELDRVLVDPKVRDELGLHLKRALAVSDAVVDEIFWQPPRPLLTTVIPTALRRLRSQWRHLELGDKGDYIADGPLPEFVVSRLFADLALPEITVVTPRQAKHEDERREQMRAVQALTAYAPGRVSHRLTVAHRFARHWLAPSDDGSGQMDIREVAVAFEELGVFGRGTPGESRVVRPLAIEVAVPPADVLSSSHGRLRWNAEIVPSGESAQRLALAEASPLGDVVDSMTFFTHGALTHVEVRRWASEADFETHTSMGTTRARVRFVDRGKGHAEVAVGLAIDVDAIAVDVRVPHAALSGRRLAPEHLRGLRTELFRDRVLNAGYAQTLGHFNAERLVECSLRVLAREALERESTIEAAYAQLRSDGKLAAVLIGDVQGYGDHSGTAPAGLTELLASIADGPALDLLDGAVVTLWDTPDASWDRWALGRLVATVGAVVHAALQELCPEYDGDDVVIDIERTDDACGLVRLWLSEQTIGGGGLIQEALRRIGDRPRTFFDLVLAGIEPSIDETVDAELTRIADLAVQDACIGEAISSVRGALTHGDRSAAFDDLLEALGSAGVFVCHPVVSALSVRTLRPGGDHRIDETTRWLLEDWGELEETLGVDFELRAYAALRAGDLRFDRRSGMSAPPDNARAWRAGQITGLLWQRGATLRSQGLRAHSPFRDLPRPDPLLLRSLLRPGAESVEAHDVASVLESDGTLARTGEVDVRATLAGARELRTAILRAACTPIEAGPLLHYPRAVAVRRDPHGIRARLALDLVGE